MYIPLPVYLLTTAEIRVRTLLTNSNQLKYQSIINGALSQRSAKFLYECSASLVVPTTWWQNFLKTVQY